MATAQQQDYETSPKKQERRRSIDEPLKFSMLNRIVLVGKTGAGKSASGNNILGRTEFKVDCSARSVTSQCDRSINTDLGVSVIDTPGLFDTELSESSVITKIVECITLSSPGPHVFLLVVPISRFTDEDNMVVTRIQNIFGEAAMNHTMVLFTRGDELVDKTINDFIQEAGPKLQRLVQLCGNRYHVFNNKDTKDTEDRKQVNQLMDKVKTMVKNNEGKCYTNDMYEHAERAIQMREDELKQEYNQKLQKIKDLESELKQANQELHLKDTDITGKTKQINDLRDQVKRINEEKNFIENQQRVREMAEKECDWKSIFSYIPNTIGNLKEIALYFGKPC